MHCHRRGEVVCFSVDVCTTWPSQAQNLLSGENPPATACLLPFNLVFLQLKPCLQQRTEPEQSPWQANIQGSILTTSVLNLRAHVSGSSRPSLDWPWWNHQGVGPSWRSQVIQDRVIHSNPGDREQVNRLGG